MKLFACDGLQPLPTMSCKFEACPGNPSSCCCPLGYRVKGERCEECRVAQYIHTLRELPVVYALRLVESLEILEIFSVPRPKDSGWFAYHVMDSRQHTLGYRAPDRSVSA